MNSCKEKLGLEALTQAAGAVALSSCGLCPNISTHLEQTQNTGMPNQILPITLIL